MTPSRIEKALDRMRRSPASVSFKEVVSVCTYFFGAPRQSGTSHVIFTTPWSGDPRVNVQNARGKAKAYQVRQVIKAIDRLEEDT